MTSSHTDIHWALAAMQPIFKENKKEEARKKSWEICHFRLNFYKGCV